MASRFPIVYLAIALMSASPQNGIAQTKVETFHPNKRVNELFFVVDKKGTRDGRYLRFHQTGKIVEEGTYDKGRKVGLWWNYYTNGMVKSIFDQDSSKAVEFTLNLYRFSNSYSNYPPEAKNSKLEGKVELSFYVDSLCRCSGLHIVKSTNSIFDSEALKAGELEIKQLEKEQNLKCDNRQMMLPVTFQLH